MDLPNSLKIIGNTPLIYLDEFNGCRLFGKLESVNPAGSIKDRVALYLVVNALEKGLVKEGDTIIEPTSGNTGIGLAYVARELNLKAVMVMPDNMSKERIAFIEKYGGEVVLTKASEGMQGSVAKARELVRKLKGYMPDQFNNPVCRRAHFETTAPEIFKELPTANYIVGGVGCGGTVMGISDYIRANGLTAEVYGVEPAASRVLRGGEFAPHKIQGIGANFVPGIMEVELLNGILPVTDEDAFNGKAELMESYKVFCGISSGAAFAAGKALSKSVSKGDIVVILPDSGNRYVS